MGRPRDNEETPLEVLLPPLRLSQAAMHATATVVTDTCGGEQTIDVIQIAEDGPDGPSEYFLNSARPFYARLQAPP